MNANFNQAVSLIREYKKTFDIIAISETWLNSCQTGDYDLLGYEVFFTIREYSRGGGVAIYVNRCIKHGYCGVCNC